MASRRKRRRRNTEGSLQKRSHLSLADEPNKYLIKESESNEAPQLSDIKKVFGLSQHHEVLPWALNHSAPQNADGYGKVPLLRDTPDDGQDWYVLGDLKFCGNFIGLSELVSLRHQPPGELFLKWDVDLVQLVVKCSLNFNNRECCVYLNNILKPLCELENIDEMCRLYRIGGARFVYCLPSDNSPTLNVSILLGNIVLNNGAVPDALPQKSSCSVKNFLLQFLCPDVFMKSSDTVPGCSILEESLGDKLDFVVIGFAAKILQFYKFVQTHQQYLLNGKTIPDLPPIIPLFTAQLLDYQKRAVQWMLYKERADGWRNEEEEKEEKELLHVLWREVLIEGKPSLYYNLFTGRLSPVKFLMPGHSKGGILADEMGLGKTVEILALMLIHQWPQKSSNNIKEYLENRISSNFINEDVNLATGGECIVEGNGSVALCNKTAGNSYGEGAQETDNHSSNKAGGQTLDSNTGLNSNGIEEEIHCLCGNSSGVLVLCDICLTWHHAPCVDFDRKECEDYICISCLLKEPIECGSTLVIVPDTLLHQWLEEIDKHCTIDSSQVMIYKGVSKEYINPLHLIFKDIVLVTYETIRKELDRVHHHEFTRKLRHPKSYSYPPSPLLAIRWWRVCLDEAQMVETSHSKAAEMTCKLSSHNRWCITGTPVERDLRDLYGLVNFLDYRPYSIHQWWSKLILMPYCNGNPRPIVALFSQIMWRNSKEDVSNELNWPELEEKVHLLSLSPIEAYYYQRQEDICYKMFENVSKEVSESSANLSDLDRSLVNKLLRPLHKLRLACCHPQLVKNGYINFSSFKNSYLSMDDLLKKMIVQAKQEGRESLRQLVSAINGIAGIHILQGKFRDAVDAYREAMCTWKSYKDNYECDRLQRIHTMENLSSLIKEGHSSHCFAITDDQLDILASELRYEYIKKQYNEVTAAVHGLSVAASKVRTAVIKAYSIQCFYLESELMSVEGISCDSNEEVMEEEEGRCEEEEEEEVDEEDIDEEIDDNTEENNEDIEMSEVEHYTNIVTDKPPDIQWWASAVSWCTTNDCESELYSMLQYELNSFQDSFIGFHSLAGFQYSVVSFLDKLENERESILHSLSNLTQCTSESDVQAATQCHLRVIKGAPTCMFCQVEAALKNYESLLFSQHQIRTDENFSSRLSSVHEKFLKCILSFLSSKNGPPSLIKSGKSYMLYLEALRNEFKSITRLWMAAEQQIRAYDELSMAAKRFQLVPLDSSDTVQTNDVLLTRLELDPKMLQFESDAKVSKMLLNKNMRQLNYLQNLTKTNDSDEASNCPICAGPLQQAEGWAVLPCGHCYCLECVYTLLRHHAPSNHQSLFLQIEETASKRIQLSCPMCREKLLSHEINFVKKSLLQEESLPAPMIGSYSTKVAAVIGTLLKIKQDEPNTKSLVFSSSMQVLKLISYALNDNHLDHAFLTTKKEYQVNLRKFKTSLTLNVLLMHMSSGSKGLNIVEATRIIFVEPFLNIGAELQAVGRVHRMGQTKSVVVHKFIIRSSVEERIRELMSNSRVVAKDKYGFTVDQLKNLFC